MASTRTKKAKSLKEIAPKGQSGGEKHSQLGKALIEAFEDIRKGNVTVLRKGNLKEDLRKLFK